MPGISQLVSGVPAVFSRSRLGVCGSVFLMLAWLASSTTQAQATNYALGTATLLVGSAAGSNSVVLAVIPQTGAWTATANTNWLHLSLANQNGIGSTNVIFSYDSNTGVTRSGTLTIGDQSLAVTQAGSSYVATTGGKKVAPPVFAESGLVATLVASNLNIPYGVAVDGAGNVYIANTGSNTIEEWTATNNAVTTLVSTGLSSPYGVAVDGDGNVYIADTGNSTIKEWTVTNNIVTTLVSSGLNRPQGVALDGAGNVYIADTGNNAIKEWTAASNAVTTVVSSGVNHPYSIAVDGAGNVYFSDYHNNAIKVWTAASNTVSTLVPEVLNGPSGVAVDAAGNVYIADVIINVIREVPHAFVDPTPKLESLASDNDALPAVLPTTASLLAPFAPTTDQPWVTINGITNGVVGFSLTASAYSRTADIILLGQTIPILQRAPLIAPTNSLGATSLLEAPIAGSDSVILALVQNSDRWANTANAPWLHLDPANQSGAGSTNVIFSYDANTGPTRSGTLTIDGLTLTVTQAGSSYVAAGTVTTLVGSGISDPYGVAVDSVGNVYIANTGSNAIVKWTVANNTVATLVSEGLKQPSGVAVDGAGNVYIADTANDAIKEWNVANNTVTTLVASGLFLPFGLAVDGAGNVYIADTEDGAVKEWTGASNNVLTLTLVSSGLSFPNGVAVDEAGNVYIANTGSNAIEEWTAVNNTVTTLVSSETTGVAVDGARNVYIADTYDSAIKELPYAFVDPTPKLEGLAAGSDALPSVLPTTENLLPPFAPTSDQPWLTITGVTNGIVSFSFTANSGSARTANISLLGQTIPITQGVIGTPPSLTGIQMLRNGVLQFDFTNNPSGSFTVLSTTNLALPMSVWTVVGTASNTAPGQFQFTSQPTTNDSQRFYGVRSP